MAKTDNTVTAEDLLGRARAMVPVVRERAARCEELRRLPEETEREFREAGFYRALQPARLGGLELDYGIQTALAAEIGRGCASSAWNLSVVAAHGWMLGMFPPEAQDEIWGTAPDATLSTSFLPKGPDNRIGVVDGGITISGRWGFSSGVDYCQAAILQLDLPPEQDGGRPRPYFALLPRSDYAIEDCWYASGLAGTGSNDIVVADAFVPVHRLLAIMDTRGGPTPGSAVNPGYLYQLPMFAVFPFNLVGPAIGAARGAVEAVAEGLSKRRSSAGTPLAGRQNLQLRIAEAGAEADAAHALIARHADEIAARDRAGIVPDTETRVRYRRDLGFAAMLCVQAVEHLLPVLGGRGLIRGDPVQRAWRDVHAAAQHIGLTWDVQALLYGAVATGFDCPDPRL